MVGVLPTSPLPLAQTGDLVLGPGDLVLGTGGLVLGRAIQAASRVIRKMYRGLEGHTKCSQSLLCLSQPSPVPISSCSEHFAIRRFQSMPVRLLGHSPVLRNITNSQAPDGWRKSEASGGAASSSGEDKENVRFWKAGMGALWGEEGACWGSSLACEDPPLSSWLQDGFVFKMPWKPPHLTSAHALAEWASRREAFAQRPSSAPDLMVHPESWPLAGVWGGNLEEEKGGLNPQALGTFPQEDGGRNCPLL
ncbi:hypothetical protein P7K49_009410 [Saguinus oedipus]|uniref:Uncharacterized protein n=1 Tax=Saguinus oedipus TaxID=9490 RepID=A0ABQ9VJV8_SAGOE|nr:hypothetical protein P7K49_009410 [Saguinus oedipus]